MYLSDCQQCKRQLCNIHLMLWGFSPFAACRNGFSAPNECVVHSVNEHGPEMAVHTMQVSLFYANPHQNDANEPLLCKLCRYLCVSPFTTTYRMLPSFKLPLSGASLGSSASSGVFGPRSLGRPSNSGVRVVAESLGVGGVRVGLIRLRGVGHVGIGRMGASWRCEDDVVTAGARGTLAVDAVGRGHSGYAGGINSDGEFDFAVAAGVGCSLGRLAVWVRARDVRHAGCWAREGEGSGPASGGAGDVLLQGLRQLG